MTDLDTLLSQAAHSPAAPAPQALVDADLARGRRALNHRRMRRTGTRSVLAGALVIGGFAAYSSGAHPSPGTTTSASPTTTTTTTDIGTPATTAITKATTKAPTASVIAGIKLVAWTGKQPQGYTVDSVPTGWEIQGVSNYSLTIAPVGFADKDINDFEGKLVVMLQSRDDSGTPTGNPVTVGTRPGVVNHEPGNEGPTLYFTDSAGHRLDIQVPAALHWSDSQVAAFGAAVHVNPTAEAGRG